MFVFKRKYENLKARYHGELQAHTQTAQALKLAKDSLVAANQDMAKWKERYIDMEQRYRDALQDIQEKEDQAKYYFRSAGGYSSQLSRLKNKVLDAKTVKDLAKLKANIVFNDKKKKREKKKSGVKNALKSRK
jgi:CHASE3 domain sensor protein